MNENKTSMYPKLYTLHSQKGGVGKTSIAIAIGGLEAIYHGKKTVIIDADMTGTSLEDIFSETPASKYFNELILAGPTTFEKCTSMLREQKPELSAFRQRIGEHELYYMPSSPIYREIKRVVPLISQEDYLHFFRRRVEDIVVATLADNFEVIVIDHSPGLFGLSSSLLEMMLDQVARTDKDLTRLTKLMQMSPNKKELLIKSVLVTTPDPVDHTALLSSFSHILKEKSFNAETGIVGKAVALINNKAKATEGGIFDPVFAMQTIFDSQKRVPAERLAEPWIIDALRKHTENTGAVACQDVVGFDMRDIILTVSAVKDTEQDAGPLGTWCRQVGVTLGILEPRGLARP